jgi:acetyltransferase-like isoleucine patch superfamily enzyme
MERGATLGGPCASSRVTSICDGVSIGDGVFVGHGVIFVNHKFPRALQPGTTWDVPLGATVAGIPAPLAERSSRAA